MLLLCKWLVMMAWPSFLPPSLSLSPVLQNIYHVAEGNLNMPQNACFAFYTNLIKSLRKILIQFTRSTQFSVAEVNGYENCTMAIILECMIIIGACMSIFHFLFLSFTDWPIHTLPFFYLLKKNFNGHLLDTFNLHDHRRWRRRRRYVAFSKYVCQQL